MLLQQPEAIDETYLANEGPWGRLELTPIVIAPSEEAVKQYYFEKHSQPWRFHTLGFQQVEELLRRVGMPEDTIVRLMANAAADQSLVGIRLLPDPEVLRGLSATVRGALYEWLGHSDRQSLQSDPFRFCGDSLEEWLRDADLCDETIDLVRPYIYRQGSSLRFADLPAVVPHIPDEAELRRLVRALVRERTMLARLHVRRGDDIDRLANYWGRGHRTQDIRPFLESLTQFRHGQLIDIVHLLPPFARRLVYTHPRPFLDGRDDCRDCYWTALNFFNEVADDQLLNPVVMRQIVQRNWQAVDGPPLFGDVALFHDGRGVAYHAAVHLADDLVFGRNGKGMGRAWLLMHLKDLNQWYSRGPAIEVQYLRRKDLI